MESERGIGSGGELEEIVSKKFWIYNPTKNKLKRKGKKLNKEIRNTQRYSICFGKNDDMPI